MSMNSKELFTQLLKQIEMDLSQNESSVLETGEIKEVTVHKKVESGSFI